MALGPRSLGCHGLYHNIVHTSIFVMSDRSREAFFLEGTTQAPPADVYEFITAFIGPHGVSPLTEKVPEVGASRMHVYAHTCAHTDTDTHTITTPGGFAINRLPS